MTKALSVIIPTYNRQETICRALDSVVSQTLFQPGSKHDDAYEIEVIVVDDGSRDQTYELIKDNYPDVVYHALSKNYGVSYARNRGIELAKAEWIAFLDSDDEWLDIKLERQFEALKQSQLKMCHTEEIWIRNGVRVNAMNKHKKRGGWLFQHCLPLCVISPSSVLMHRSLFDEFGMFDENLPACEDYDLWLRLCALNEVSFVEEPCVVKHGGHEDQLSRKYWGMDRFRIIALEKALQSNTLKPEDFDAAKKMLINKLTILQKGAVKHENQTIIDWASSKLITWNA